MIKYIDKGTTRQHLIQRLYETALNDDENYLVYLYLINDRLQVWIDEIPAADVEEVRHGRWIKKYRGNYLCSVCGAWYRTKDDYGNIIDGEMTPNYCESCGARMDEVEE